MALIEYRSQLIVCPPQAGGKKGRATVDHHLVIKGIIQPVTRNHPRVIQYNGNRMREFLELGNTASKQLGSLYRKEPVNRYLISHFTSYYHFIYDRGHINKVSVAIISALMKSLFINKEYLASIMCNESYRHIVKKNKDQESVTKLFGCLVLLGQICSTLK